VALRGAKEADDHLNLKALMSDDQGRVFAVTKTSLDEKSGASKSSPQIRLLVFRPGTGSWSSTTFGTLSDCHTRPQLVLDEQNQRVYVFATGPTASGCPYTGAPGTIYMKSAPMSDPVFTSGRGTPVIRDASSEGVNNVTSTKQPVNAGTGLVVLAANGKTDRYWHADIALAGTPSTPVPVSSFTATPQSGSAPLTVQFADTSTNDPTGWSWSFGDGRTSTAQNPSITYQDPGDYTVTLVARNASGAGSTATRTISVSAPPPTGGGDDGDITRMSTSTAFSTTASTSLSIPAPAGTQPGDVLVTCLAMNGSSLAAPAPGFTRMAAPTGLSNPRVYGYVKVAGADEPADYVWKFHASVASAGGIARYSGSSGLDGESSTATGASSKTATVPSVTTSTSGAMLVGCMGLNTGSTSISITGPAGLAEGWDLAGKRHWYGDGLLGAAGPTGSRTWSFSSSREWSGWLVALRPS
jgi:PKD repeat protein